MPRGGDRDDTRPMPLRVEFEGGPADGTVHEYPDLGTALPSLYWSRDEPQPVSAVYHRASADPDPQTGRWRYVVVPQR